MEYISLHRYIRNTPADAEVHAEHQLRADKSIWTVGKKTQNHAKLSRVKELGGKTGVLVGLDLPSASGGTEPGGSDPHIQAIV